MHRRPFPSFPVDRPPVADTTVGILLVMAVRLVQCRGKTVRGKRCKQMTPNGDCGRHDNRYGDAEARRNARANAPLDIPLLASDASLADGRSEFETLTDACKTLAADPDPVVRADAAAHTATPPDTLAELAADIDERVRVAAASNPDTPPGALARLAAYEPGGHPESMGAIFNPNCPPEAAAKWVDEFVDRPSRWVYRLAEHPSISDPDVLRSLSNDPDDAIRARTAANPNLPDSMFDGYSRREETNARTVAANNKNCPPRVLTRLADDHSLGVQAAVACNPNTPPEVLAKLASTNFICDAALANPNCPPEAIEQFAKGDTAPRLAAASNPNCPPKLFKKFVKQKQTRPATAANPSLPADQFAEFAADKELTVRAAFAANPKCPRGLLAQLAADPESAVVFAALSNPNCPAHLTKAAATNSDHRARRAAIGWASGQPR